MEKGILDPLFESIQVDLKENLAKVENNELAPAVNAHVLKGSGSIPFDFKLDQNGNYHFKTSKYGAGVTVHASAVIESPQGVYSVTVKSSDGGGGHWDNVSNGQVINCSIKTSFWHSTTIEVYLSCPQAAGQSGKAIINYNY